MPNEIHGDPDAEDFLPTHGYTISREYCGHPEMRYVVRQYGEWRQSYPTREDAVASIYHRGGYLVGFVTVGVVDIIHETKGDKSP